MTHYAIGDIQGCFDQLIQLLDKLHFSPETDTLWFTGDLVNRGPKSLETLRFVSKLPKVVVTLGNHDLRLLTYVFGKAPLVANQAPTLENTLQAPDLAELCHWLRRQVLLHHDADLGYTLVHAGLAPQWSLSEALAYAREVETVLRGEDFRRFLAILPDYLSHSAPTIWQDSLQGDARLGCLINYFTRIRFCDLQGGLDLKTKDRVHPIPREYVPWFRFPTRATQSLRIIFGHWAALHGKTSIARIHALDTGCDHGFRLTALCLQNEKLTSVSCH